MPIRRTPNWRVTLDLTALSLITLALAMILLAGCKAHVAEAGEDREILAAYRFRTLSADLPSQVSVHAASAAAQSALRGRGYIVTKTQVNTDAARIEARSHGDNALEKTVVEARLSSGATRITVTAEPLGDESASRAILDAMLARLGR